MGRKKGHIVTLKPFCYYCDKEFNNELILHQHQKARHFNCVKCHKRFSTAPALDTHEFQVHKKTLDRVPNAKAGRDSFEISIYGMDGVPLELINYKLAEKVEQKKRKLIQQHKLISNDENDKKDEINYLKNKEKKEKDICDLLKKTNIEGGSRFYHNPDSINLTLKQNQMESMYIMKNNDINNTNILLGNNKIENKSNKDGKKIKSDKKHKEKEKEKETDKNINNIAETTLTLEQFNKELD